MFFNRYWTTIQTYEINCVMINKPWVRSVVKAKKKTLIIFIFVFVCFFQTLFVFIQKTIYFDLSSLNFQYLSLLIGGKRALTRYHKSEIFSSEHPIKLLQFIASFPRILNFMFIKLNRKQFSTISSIHLSFSKLT